MAVLVVVASACTATPKPTPTPNDLEVERGGTLRIVESDQFALDLAKLALDEDFDPQRAFWGNAWELFRCCLLRTLVSYDVDPANSGKIVVRPDLAVGPPDVTADGLTWTFHLRSGLHYGPPLQSTPIVAADIVRALQRAGDERIAPSDLTASSYFSVIRGFDAYQHGEADSISGLETPDNLTLVIHLVRPVGDLPYLLAVPGAAPIPPNPADLGAPYGVATGHYRYGPFLVSSGPYMLEGSEDLDFSGAPDEQEPVEGFVPGKSLTLVRNPAWRPASDPLRPSFVERIEVSIGGSREEALRAVESGDADVSFETLTGEQIEGLRSAGLQDQIHFGDDMSTVFVSLNLAVPPFDDIHVRRAVNLVVDKARLMSLAERFPRTILDPTNVVATHFAPDILENQLLLGYDPYSTAGTRGDVRRARAEMRLSRYDTDGDGICDDPVCVEIWAPTIAPFVGRLGSASIVGNLRELGLDIQREFVSFGEVHELVAHPERAVPLFIARGWLPDYPSASTYFVPLFSGTGYSNTALTGVTPEQLLDWGYSTNDVPSIDDRIAECQALEGADQVECWARLDKHVMEEVVPIVPLIWGRTANVVSERVARYSFDPLSLLPALDQLGLQTGSS